MKRLLAVLTAVSMLALSGIAYAEPTSATATADGFGGPVSVTVTVEDGTITEVTATGDAESSPELGNDLTPLADQILAAQSADIEGVSGATMTSAAVKSAAAAAIAEASGAGNEAAFNPGTYTESVMGRNAALTIEVTLGESTIDKVEIKDHAETEYVAGVALERIPAEIVEKQTTKIDAVSGATVTSSAIKTAVNMAIEEAGASPAALPEAYAQAGDPIEATADIVIVGGGGAGMAAAVAALENGASVIVVEKTAMLGGNTVVCGGVLNAADTEWASQFDVQTGEIAILESFRDMNVEDFPEEYQADFLTLKGQIEEYLAGDTTRHFDSIELHTIMTYYYGLRNSLDGDVVYSEYDLASTMTKNAMDTVNWLAEEGVQWQDVVTQATGGMWRRGHNPSMDKGQEYVAVLGPAINSKGGTIMYETRANALITDDSGRVVGVEANKTDGTPVTLHADKAVILATGGYGHNTKMVQETDNYWGNIPDDIGTTNASGSTGDGIVMATAVGAATTGMEYTQLMAIADPESGDLFTGLVPMSTANYVFVNQEGNRFVNESAPRDVLAAAAIENGGLFYMIADINIAEDSRWLSNWEEQVERQNTIMADTLEELADKLGFDETAKANFLKAMENYNSYVDAGEDPECGKTSFALKVEQGPFFASPRKPAIHHTMGGLKINATTEVLNENGEAIPGLYAAGEVCGGIHAGNRIGGNAVADALVFGRIAGETASTQN